LKLVTSLGSNLETALAVFVLLALAWASVLIVQVRRALLEFRSWSGRLGAQCDTARHEHNLWAAQIQQDLAAVRGSLQESHASRAGLLDALSTKTRNASISGIATAAKLDEFTVRIGAFTSSLDLLAERAPGLHYLDPALTHSRSDAELLSVAQSLAILRPLTPYPGWQRNVGLHNPEFSYRLRRWLWQYFRDVRPGDSIVIPWHENTRLRLFFGSEFGAPVYIAGCWEPNQFAFLDRILRPGMTFLDVGANEGIFTVFAAKRASAGGRVWAFESRARELERLRYNLDLNNLDARVFPVALAGTNSQESSQTVTLLRLDDIVAAEPPARIDVLKMDVEGGELHVLRGAVNALQKYRPVILFEVSEKSLRNQASSGAELVEFVRAQRYAIHTFDSSTGLVVPAEPGASGASGENLIAVPEEMTLPESTRLPWPTV
jgi:hypothetical protein